MMMFASETSMEEDIIVQPECELDLDKMAQQVQNLIKFKHFYAQVDFNP